MIKRLTLGFLMIFVLSLLGCDNSESAVTEEEGSNDSNNENEETFQFIASTHSPPEIPLTVAWDTFLDEIEKRSDGRIEFERYHNGALSDGFDVLNTVNDGVADIALIFPGWQSGRLSLIDVGSNPALFYNSWPGIMAMNELEKEIPEIGEQLAQNGIVNVGNFQAPPLYFISTSEITGFDDLEGLQVLTNSEMQATMANELGMTPVGMNLTDAYDALTRGIVDTVLFSAQGAMSFGLHESAKNAWKLPMGTMSGMYGMNKDKWDSLPEDLQEIILEVKEEFQPESFHQIYQGGEEEYESKFADEGGNIVEPDEADMEVIEGMMAETIWSDWIEKQDENNLPGKETLDTFKELVEKYEAENPLN